MSETCGIIIPQSLIISDRKWSAQPASAAVAATSWSTTDNTGTGTLSNSNRTYTHSTGGNSYLNIRSVAGTLVGQDLYLEYVINVVTFSAYLGMGTIGGSLAGGFPGIGSPSTAFYIASNGNFRCVDSADDNTAFILSITAGDRVGLAVKTTAGKVWFRKNGGAWNAAHAGTQDPVTNQGGASIPFAGPYYAIAGEDAVDGDAFTANFATSSWVDPAPTGFTQLAA